MRVGDGRSCLSVAGRTVLPAALSLQEFAIPEEEAEWVGLSLEEAIEKQRMLEKKVSSWGSVCAAEPNSRRAPERWRPAPAEQPHQPGPIRVPKTWGWAKVLHKPDLPTGGERRRGMVRNSCPGV